MSDKTKIEWTDATWNPIRGCSRVSEGCRNCYAERQAVRFNKAGQPYEGLAKLLFTGEGAETRYVGPRWTGEVRFIEEHLEDPLHWTSPKRIFVNSMSDLFHENVKDEWIDRIFAVMALCPQHIFQVLTKRPERMLEWSKREWSAPMGFSCIEVEVGKNDRGHWVWSHSHMPDPFTDAQVWPLRNVQLGVSVEDQKTADERIPLLLQTPAAVRWVSYEPALGPVNFEKFFAKIDNNMEPFELRTPRPSWIVVGGESGPDARPFDIQWARDTIAQCKEAGVPCFVKQLGANVHSRNDNGFEGDTPHSWPMDTRTDDGEAYQGASVRVRLKDRKGGDWQEWPSDLRVREYPK